NPRSGGTVRRDVTVHAETAQCIACHPSQFSTRGTLFAYKNGYEVDQKEALRFIAERIYNNARPLYGVPGATWIRVAASPAAVVARTNLVTSLYETVTGESRPLYHKGAINYITAYYDGRKDLNPDEDEQN